MKVPSFLWGLVLFLSLCTLTEVLCSPLVETESAESTCFQRTKNKLLLGFVLGVSFSPSLIFLTCHWCHEAGTGHLSVATTAFHTRAFLHLGSENVAFLQHFLCASVFTGDGQGAGVTVTACVTRC